MNAKNINEILDALAARLSVPASHLWGVLVRQAAVEFWSSVGVAALFIAVFAACYRWFKPLEREYEEPGPVFGAVGLVLLAVVTLILTAIAISNIGYLINPEYYALREVLGALK